MTAHYSAEFDGLEDCVAHIRTSYPTGWITESRDIDTGAMFRTRFPRWLFRGEHDCYPTSRPSLTRFRQSRTPFVAEVEQVTDFVHRYTVHHLVLPYIGELDHFTSVQWLAAAATYEALALCQHYGLPTAFMDFTASVRVAAAFAAAGPLTDHGRIAVLDVAQARAHSQIIDLRHFAVTRAARQQGFGLYVPGHADLCDPDVQRKLGITWFRFRRDLRPERLWRRGFPALLRVSDDRLAGWPRHAISIYARQAAPVSADAASWLAGRVPMVPLIAERKGAHGQIAFLPPDATSFDAGAEAAKSIRDWTRERIIQPDRRFRVHRPVGGSNIVRFTGT